MTSTNSPSYDPFRDTSQPPPSDPLDSYKTRNCADGSPRVTLQRHNPDGSVDLLVAPCDSWTCPRCARRQRQRLVHKVVETMAKHGLHQWLHLTLRWDGPPRPDRDAKRLLNKWAALRSLYAKHHDKKLPFVWFKHIENGRPHLHIFTCGLDLEWVEREWRKRTGAFQIRLAEIDPTTMPTPVWYATRMIYDNALEYGTSCGRWWGKSQGIEIDLRERGKGDGEWTVSTQPLDAQAFSPDQYDVGEWSPLGHPLHVRLKPPAQGGPHAR